MKRREVGKYFKRIELDLERPDGSLSTLLENHWTMETDPLRMAAEAVVWLRSRELPEFPTASCSLSHRLRSVHHVKLDSVDDFAARIIDEVVCLELIGSGPRSIPVAVELGMVYALFHVYAEEDRRRKKRRQSKRAVWDELVKSLGDVSSPEEAWSAIPEASEGEHRIKAGGVQWLVYRDGDWLHAVKKERTGAQKSIKPIKRTTFFRYFTRASKNAPALHEIF